MATAPVLVRKRTSDWLRTEVRVRGLRISVLERRATEPSTAPPILLLHGLVSEGTCYRRLLRRLPANRRIIALDLPGAGYSDRPPQDHQPGCVNFRDLAACVVEIIEALGLQRPVLIGHSHGGALALTLASLSPHKVSGLALICPAHPYSGVERRIVRFYLSSVGHAFAHLLPRLPDSVMLFVFRHMPGSRRTLEMTDIAPYLHTLRSPGTVDHILRMVSYWNNDMHQLATRLDAEPLSMPVLLLWGERDVVVPAWTAKRLAARLTDSTVVKLAGVGHLPNDEAPNKAASIIQHWLERSHL